MPLYLVERTLPDGIGLPGPAHPPAERQRFIDNNQHEGVVWLSSYVSQHGRKVFCLYEAPEPAALRRAAQRNDLPIDRISEVRQLHPLPN